MDTSVFIVVVVGMGVLLGVLFWRMGRRWEGRHPGDRKNPITWWLKGRFDDDEK